MNTKLKMVLKRVLMRSVRLRLKMKKLVTVLILGFPCNIILIIFAMRLRILTNNNPEHGTVTNHCRHDDQDEGHVPKVNHGPGHIVTVKLERTGNCSMEQFSRIKRMDGGVDSPIRKEGGVEADDAGVDQEGSNHLVFGNIVARHLKLLKYKS